MLKKKFKTLLVLIPITCLSQDYLGITKYKSFRTFEVTEGFDKYGKMTESNKSKVRYEFNELESLYLKEEELESPSVKKGGYVLTIRQNQST